MKSVTGVANLLLLATNLSALGTIAYKGKLWQSAPIRQPVAEIAHPAIDLSPVQTERLTAERAAFLGEWEKTETELQESRARLLAAIRDAGNDRNEVRPMVEEVTRLLSKAEQQAVDQLLREKAILTPEQSRQYFSLLENRMLQSTGRMRRYRGGRGMQESRSSSSPSERPGRESGRGWRAGR